MALQHMGTLPGTFGLSGVSASGIVEVTSARATKRWENRVVGKKSNGDIGAILFTKQMTEVEASGYTNLTGAPPLGGSVSAFGASGTVMQSSIERTNEDFAKATVTGKALS